MPTKKGPKREPMTSFCYFKEHQSRKPRDENGTWRSRFNFNFTTSEELSTTTDYEDKDDSEDRILEAYAKQTGDY